MSDMLRITGLATGLDTDNMVKQMMKPYNIRLDKMKQDNQIFQWKQDLYRDIMKDILDLRSSFMDVVKPEDNVLMSNTYSAYEAAITSGSGALTISTSASAVAGEYKVDITNIAKKARLEGNKLTASGVQATLSTKISELDINNGKSVDGKTIKIELGADTSYEISLTSDKTIGTIVDDINKNLGGKVSARFSELSGTLIIESSATGKNVNLSISDSSSPIDTAFTALNALGMTSSNVTSISKTGDNAKVTITPPGGNAIANIEKDTNNFTIDGITYNLLKEGVSSTFAVNPSEQKTFDKLKAFIDKYNSVIDKIQTKIYEKKEYSYKPLTEDQKKNMKEEEISGWEAKAKQGLLKGDPTLQKLLIDLRSAFTTPVIGSEYQFGNQGSKSIGIDTSSSYMDGGKIIIKDENKLKQSIRNNPQDIMNLFTRISTNTIETEQYKETGIFRRIEDVIKNNLGPIGTLKGFLVDKAGYKGSKSEFNNILSKQIIERERKITSFQDDLLKKENRFYIQFASLEKYMNQMNSQSAWLAQQLGGGNA